VARWGRPPRQGRVHRLVIWLKYLASITAIAQDLCILTNLSRSLGCLVLGPRSLVFKGRIDQVKSDSRSNCPWVVNIERRISLFRRSKIPTPSYHVALLTVERWPDSKRISKSWHSTYCLTDSERSHARGGRERRECRRMIVWVMCTCGSCVGHVCVG